MKKALLIIGGAAGAILLLFFAAWQLLNSSWLGNVIAEKTFKATGSRLEFATNPVIGFFPPTFSLSSASWKSAGSGTRILFSAQEIRIYFEPLSLLREQFEIREIFLNEPVLEIISKASPDAGVSGNLSGNQPFKSASDKLPFILNRLVLQNGRFVFKTDKQAFWLSELNVSAENFSPRQETDLKCDFIASTGPAQLNAEDAVLSGNMAMRSKIRYYPPNLTFRQTAITFTATRNPTAIWLSPISLDGEGAINLDDFSLKIISSNLKSAPCQLILKGDYEAPAQIFKGHASLEINPASDKAEFQEDGHTDQAIVMASPVHYKNATIEFPDIAISSGNSKGSGKLELTLPMASRVYGLRGRLAFGKVDLPVIKSKKNDRGHSVELMGGEEKEEAGETAWPRINLDFSAAALKYGRLEVNNLGFLLEGKAGVYELKNLLFSWADGKCSGQGQVNFPDKRIRLDSSGDGLNIGQALWELGFNGFRGGTADFEASLASNGFDPQAIKSGLEGKFSFRSRNVKITILEEMASFLGRFSKAASLLPEGIESFSVDAQAQKGKISMDPILLASSRLKASATGEIDLASNRLDAQLNLDALGMSLPIAIDGKFSDLSWHIEPVWLKKLWP